MRSRNDIIGSDYIDQGIGDRFQQETKYYEGRPMGHVLVRSSHPEPYKNCKDHLGAIPLPEPDIKIDDNIWQLLQSRRSRRRYDPEKTLRGEILSTLLWATQGVTERHGNTLFRTAPSAGALYPVETYLFLRAVEGYDPGIYHFRPHVFDLELLKKGDYSRELGQAALGQMMVARAQVTFIWSAVVERAKWKYHQRAYRYIYLDAGHIGQNLYLAAETLGLGVCTIGALFDEQVNNIIGVDGVNETTIYMATVGWPKKR